MADERFAFVVVSNRLPVDRVVAEDGSASWKQSPGGLVTALDTGGAIRGPVRADLYLGRGEAAGLAAGRVRHPLRMWRLTPR